MFLTFFKESHITPPLFNLKSRRKKNGKCSKTVTQTPGLMTLSSAFAALAFRVLFVSPVSRTRREKHVSFIKINKARIFALCIPERQTRDSRIRLRVILSDHQERRETRVCITSRPVR